jgi:hypothetical protein
MSNQISFAITSTVVAPFQACKLLVAPLTTEQFKELCSLVAHNFCGHPVTLQKLQEAGVELPAAQKGQFWDMKGVAIAARPLGGVRGASEVQLSGLEELEFCAFCALDPQSEEEQSDLEYLLAKLWEDMEGFGTIREEYKEWFADFTSQCAVK